MPRHVVFLACSVALLACVMETPSTAQPLDKRHGLHADNSLEG